MKFLRAMKKLKIKQQIIAAVMACVLGIGGIYSVHASVINDAKNKKNEAQQELDNLNSQIDEIQAAQSDLQEEMDAYDDQLMALLTDMDLLENDMDHSQRMQSRMRLTRRMLIWKSRRRKSRRNITR